MDYAFCAYAPAAEQGVVLVAFDEATVGKYSTNVVGMRRELVLCLENAAEMALGLRYHRALSVTHYYRKKKKIGELVVRNLRFPDRRHDCCL